MDDLISRKAVAEKMKNRRDYVGRPSDPDCIIADEPSVPAVPIEPLCRYLEVYARTPIYNMRHTAKWWKEELEKEKWENWTVEQNATD